MMASEETSPCQEVIECDLCQKPVSFFCRRCGVNLCDTCIPVHLRVKSKTGHDVVDYMSKDDDDTCFCDSHPKQECSAYCQTCESPICVVCITIKHKSHEISELSDKIEKLLQDIAKNNDRLQSFRRKIEVLLNDTAKQLSSLSSVYQKEKDEVTAQGEKWHRQIDDHVERLHRELDDLKEENEAVLQKQSKDFEEMIWKMNKINREFKSLQKSTNVKKIQKFKQVIQEQHKPVQDIIQYAIPTFQKCKSGKDNMRQNFGYIEKMPASKISLLEQISPGSSSDLKLEATTGVSVTETELLHVSSRERALFFDKMKKINRLRQLKKNSLGQRTGDQP